MNVFATQPQEDIMAPRSGPTVEGVTAKLRGLQEMAGGSLLGQMQERSGRQREHWGLGRRSAMPLTEGDINIADSVAGAMMGTTRAAKTLRAYHSTYGDFDSFDFSRLGKETAENATDWGPGQFSYELSQLGAWLSDKSLVDAAYPGGKALAFDLAEAPSVRFGSLDDLHAAIMRRGGFESARKSWVDQGKRVIRVKDDEFGGTSYVVLDPAAAQRARD